MGLIRYQTPVVPRPGSLVFQPALGRMFVRAGTSPGGCPELPEEGDIGTHFTLQEGSECSKGKGSMVSAGVVRDQDSDI